MFGPSGFWTMAPLRYAAKFDPFLSLDCAPTPSILAQSKERKGSNFAIWQPWLQIPVEFDAVLLLPADSYLRHFIQQNKVDFPASETAKLYAGRVEYTVRDFGKIDRIAKALDDVLEYEDILTGD